MAYLHPQVQHRARDWEVKRVAQYLSPDKGCMAGLCFGEGIHWEKKTKPTIYTHVHKRYFPGTNKAKACPGSVCKGSAELAVMFSKYSEKGPGREGGADGHLRRFRNSSSL